MAGDAVPDFTLEVDGSTDVLRVLEFEGAEGLSEMWRYDLQLTSRDPALEFADIVGKKAVFKMVTGDGERMSEGIIARFEQQHHGRILTYYSARLVPKVFTLTLRKRCRMFQNLTTVDIIRKVLADHGVSGNMVSFSLNASYEKRKYCVQYRETDFDFISRLMEEEGITYFFPQGDGKQAMTLMDKASSHTVIEGEAEVPFRGEDTGMSGAEEIRQFSFRRAMRSGTVRLREYDFIKATGMEALKKGPSEEDMFEVYDYPGEFHAPGLGTRLAQVRLEEERAEREVGIGASNCRRLVAGFRFSMVEHQRDSLNAEYLLTTVVHTGRQPMAAEEDQIESDTRAAYRNEFRCIPSATQYRPRRLTPRPVIDGVQTALVVGDGEIHTDEHGRVKVKFHWDTEDNESTWVRVSQGWGGAGWGGMFIPRVGHEVVVEFIEGDPDRPLIMGRVYNGTNVPPYKLPDKKTVSTIKSETSPGGGGSNELRFEDAKGKEEIFAHAQKDWNTVIGNDRTRSVGHDETLHIKNDRKKTVDNNQTEKIGVDKKIEVGSNHDEKIGANMTLEVGADEKETIKANRTIKVMSNHDETIGGDMSLNVMKSHTENVLINWAKTVGAGAELTVIGAIAISAGGKMGTTVGGDQTINVNGKLSEEVKGDVAAKYGAKMTESVTGDLTQSFLAKQTQTVGKEYELTAKKIKITGQDEIVIECGQSKITLKKDGTLTIAGMKVGIEGTQEFKAKAMQIETNGSTKNDMKGALVTVEGSGIATIKGALVKIN